MNEERKALVCDPRILLRLGLGMVFLIFGFEKSRHPELWVIYLAPWSSGFLEWVGLGGTVGLRLLGCVEIGVGLHLIAGLSVRQVAAIAFGLLVGVILSVGFDHTGIRDLGLLVGVALPLFLSGVDDWTLDRWIDRQWPDLRNRKAFLPVWASVSALLVGLLCLSLGQVSRGGSAGGEYAAMEVFARVTGAEETLRSEPIKAIPAKVSLNRGKARLGKKLFHDPLLSRDGTIACASCHRVDEGGADRQDFSVGVGGRMGAINAPSVFNAVFNAHQFWDGRVDSLQDQALQPVENPIEMGSHWPEVVRKVAAVGEYQAAFKALYPDGHVSSLKITDCLAEYERSLITPNGRFDQWLRGDDRAITAKEAEGYRLFKDLGCISCHQGVNVGGNMFQTMGKFGNYFQDRGLPVTTEDLGRYNVTRSELDRHRFKVPSLRNVELTAPYFHDGTGKTLESAIVTMARYQLGRRLSQDETQAIAAFLKTLTGTSPRDIEL